jgi:hypothetical protein
MTSSHRLPGAAVGLALAAIAALTAPATRAQTAPINPGALFTATQTESLRSADAQVQSMLRGGELELAQIGGFGSGEVYYTITRQFAVVGGARFSRAADDLETGTDQFVSIKTGGLQVGGGVRFLF